MKNFSTVGALLAALVLPAQAQTARLPSEQVSPQRMAAVKAACEFRPDAPDQHVVVRGDTLWAIAGMFLRQPWCWPEVWDLNREQIANPHWIYPGQTVYFDRAAGKLRLGKPLGEPAGEPLNGELRLVPQVRSEALAKDAVPSIDARSIEAFLSQPLVVAENEAAGAARIVAQQEGRVYLGRDDKAYVRGDLQGATAFQVFRPGKPLKDPVTGKVIAYEAFYLGTASVTKPAAPGSDVHTVTITSVKEEMGVGDRLRPMPAIPVLNYVPHRPLQPVDARVVSAYNGVSYAGQGHIVTINKGAQDGLDIGAVLALYRDGEVIQDKTAKAGWFGRGERIKLPNEQYGTLFVFRVFDHISYGLIMQVTDAAQVGDGARSPD
jgi:hypothetical protein